MKPQLNPSEYPRFYRKAGTCVRQDGPTETWSITLKQDSKVPCRWHTTYPSPDRLQQELRGYDLVDVQIFKDFLTTFYQEVAAERDLVNSWKISRQVPPGITEPKS